MTEFRTCGKCGLYSHPLLRCLEGKANPPTLKGTISAMKIFGPSYICGFSKWKQKAILKITEEAKQKAKKEAE